MKGGGHSWRIFEERNEHKPRKAIPGCWRNKENAREKESLVRERAETGRVKGGPTTTRELQFELQLETERRRDR